MAVLRSLVSFLTKERSGARAFAAVAGTLVAVGAALVWYVRVAVWPPFLAPGDALAVVLDRQGDLPAGARCVHSARALGLGIEGMEDPVAQDRLLERIRREIRWRGRRGEMRIEFVGPPEGTRGERRTLRVAVIRDDL